MEITSVNNETVKSVVKLKERKYRDISGKFLLEGYKSVYEAVKSGIELDKVFVLKEKAADYGFIKKELIITSNNVLKKISTTETAPEIAASAIQPRSNPEVLKSASKVILLENTADAGNLGTIIRTAAAFGINAVILYGNTVDVYNPKCVRSSAGNLWKIDIIKLKTLSELKGYFSDYEKIAALPLSNSGTFLSNWHCSEKTIVMFGSESRGLTDELKQFADKNLTIEMNQDVESLNLAISAGIIMYKMSCR